jgi:hypothetical protein
MLLRIVNVFGGVILGWALGFASALFNDWVKGHRRRKAIQRAVSTELREVAYRLLSVVYLTENRHGKMDRELLGWLLAQVKRYSGPNPKDGLLASIKGLLQQTDADLAQFAAHEQAASAPSLFYPSLEASFTASAMAQANEFDPVFSERVLDILSNIHMFNEIRDNGLFYQRLTFEPGLGDANYRTVLQNADMAQHRLSQHARIIIDKITALEEQMSK